MPADLAGSCDPNCLTRILDMPPAAAPSSTLVEGGLKGEEGESPVSQAPGACARSLLVRCRPRTLVDVLRDWVPPDVSF